MGADVVCVTSHPRRRTLRGSAFALPPGARAAFPLLSTAVAAAAAAVLVVAGATVAALRDPAGAPTNLTALATLPGGHDAAAWTVAAAVARVVMFTAGAAVMWWRAAAAGPEGPVWRWLARAAAFAVVASVVAGVVDVIAVHGAPGPTVAGSAPAAAATTAVASTIFNVGVLGACPLLYQALIRWNRHGTVAAEPGDWLNGLGAVFTLAAIGNLAVGWLDSPLTSWPWWQLQLWLVRVAAEVMVLGTAATILVISGLLRDVRAWSFTLAVALAAGLDVGTISEPAAATGTAAHSDLGYAVVVVVLSISALRPAPVPSSRPTTTEAPTAGSFVVLLVSIGVLLGTGLLTTSHPSGSTTWWTMVWAATGAAAVAFRGLHSIRLLAHLITSRYEALTDDLTGLANRRALDRRLAADTAAGRSFTLTIIDLDGFKQINDRFGHAVGDEVLRRTGRLLHRTVHAPALVARLGGDEFAVLLPGRSLSAAREVFAVLAQATAEPLVVDGRRLLVQGSVGTASNERGESPEEVLRHADAAMYRAKSAGGARHEVHDLAAAQRVVQQAQLVEELKSLLGARDARDDLRPGRLVVHYQPQVSRTGQLVGAEALVRWENPRLGLVTPDAFLHLVEDYGLMYALTAEVLRQAVEQTARWRPALSLRISVNLSTTSLTHPDLPALVDHLLDRSGLPGSLLVLEITETAVMLDPETSIARLRDFSRRGIGISIDDYGSGYSSLAYLNDLPADELKLDRSLTRHVLTNSRTEDIVAGTVALAHRLRLRVIAEGVEDSTTLATLHDLGCDETQGFLHARAMDADTFTAWTATRAGTYRTTVERRAEPAATIGAPQP